MRFITDGLLKHLQPRGDDDFVDRLNYYYTPTLLLLGAALVSGKQYVQKPIQCWIPPQFTHSMEQYIESYCWIQNTYWLPAYEHIPDDYEARENRQIGYYQWVPFILLVQAILFTLPCIWWRMTNRRSGLDLHQLVGASRDIQLISDRLEKSRIFTCIAQCLGDILDLQIDSNENGDQRYSTPSLRKSCLDWRPYGFGRWRRSGYYVTVSYLITKFLYASNAIGQFFLLNAFLKNDSYQLYGFRVLIDLLSGRDWMRSGHFPRITLCDFEVRTVGNLNRYTVQCALTVNIFNEKIFVFVWIWLCVVASITAASFVCWFFSLAIRRERLAFIIDYLKIAAVVNRMNRRSFYASESTSATNYDRFVDRYLKIDGLLTLRLIAIHAGDVVTIEIVKRLWKEYRDRCEYEMSNYNYRQHNGNLIVSNSDIDDCLRTNPNTKETLVADCDSGSPHCSESLF